MPQFHRGMKGVLPQPNPPKIVILILNEGEGKESQHFARSSTPAGCPIHAASSHGWIIARKRESLA
jgi:hypothetical protein